jgi:hypothetical protein
VRYDLSFVFFVAIPFALAISIIACLVWYFINTDCVSYRTVTKQYVTQPIYVGGQHVKFPIGGGEIKMVEAEECEKRIWRK